ncbi:MAG: hypothetical protein JWR37_1398 [Mycobacterium sp.]|jgi:hypothetical protein|nr:hypothetical protein [Mycobacterium sp.]
MDLQPYVDAVRHELNVAAAAGGDDAAALAERLSAPLESSIRLALLEALSAAAEEITRELAPGSVDVRLRGRDPEFAVTAVDDLPEEAPVGEPQTDADEDGGTWRVTLRLPEHLKSRVEAAARRDGASVNGWLVRAVTAALGAVPPGRARATSDKHISGWVR